MGSLNTSTMQWIAKLFALTIAISVLGLLGIEAATIFRFGDGEAISILQQFNAPFVSLAGALGLSTFGHQLLAWLITRVTSASVPNAPPAASGNGNTTTGGSGI